MDEDEGSDGKPCPTCEGEALFDDCPDCHGTGVIFPDHDGDES